LRIQQHYNHPGRGKNPRWENLLKKRVKTNGKAKEADQPTEETQESKMKFLRSLLFAAVQKDFQDLSPDKEKNSEYQQTDWRKDILATTQLEIEHIPYLQDILQMQILFLVDIEKFHADICQVNADTCFKITTNEKSDIANKYLQYPSVCALYIKNRHFEPLCIVQDAEKEPHRRKYTWNAAEGKNGLICPFCNTGIGTLNWQELVCTTCNACLRGWKCSACKSCHSHIQTKCDNAQCDAKQERPDMCQWCYHTTIPISNSALNVCVFPKCPKTLFEQDTDSGSEVLNQSQCEGVYCESQQCKGKNVCIPFTLFENGKNLNPICPVCQTRYA
jgi:hypothetical protein